MVSVTQFTDNKSSRAVFLSQIRCASCHLSVSPHSGTRLLSSITEPTDVRGDGGEPLAYDSNHVPCEDGCEQDKAEQGGIKKVCFKVNEEEQEDSGHDTMSYRDSYR